MAIDLSQYGPSSFSVCAAEGHLPLRDDDYDSDDADTDEEELITVAGTEYFFSREFCKRCGLAYAALEVVEE